jgi:glutamyl-tRNA synthetase
MLRQFAAVLESLSPWTAEAIEASIKDFCEKQGAKLGDVAQPIRVAVSGKTISPAIGETLVLLGKEKTLRRIRTCLVAGGRAT